MSDYKAQVDGEWVSISLDKFIDINNTLSCEYKTEQNFEARQKKAATLFNLDKKLFKSWRIFDDDDREDYEQEAWFFFVKALNKYDPARGSFVHYLRWYVQKLRAEFLTKPERPTSLDSVDVDGEILASGETESAEAFDPIMLTHVKAALTPRQYAIIELRIFKGLPLEEVAIRLGSTTKTIRVHLRRAMDLLRIMDARKSSASPIDKANPADGEWIPKEKLAKLLAVKKDYLAMLMTERLDPRRCPYFIDPLDILPINGGRVRYKCTSRGLEYPRIYRRTKANEPAD